MRILFILMAISLLSFTMHPIHVSVCDVEFDSDERRLEMTMRTFTDDMEKQIREETNKPDLDILNPPAPLTSDELFEEYFKRHLKFYLKDQEVSFKYLGHEVEAASVYCYLMITDIDEVTEISAFNDVLLRTYDDQVNLIHVKVGEETHTMMFRKGQVRQSLTF